MRQPLQGRAGVTFVFVGSFVGAFCPRMAVFPVVFGSQ